MFYSKTKFSQFKACPHQISFTIQFSFEVRQVVVPWPFHTEPFYCDESLGKTLDNYWETMQRKLKKLTAVGGINPSRVP